MKFLLFSKISFEIPDPIALIECYCYQSDFYTKYDLLKNRKVEDVNKIGARIKKELLTKCEDVSERTKNLSIFTYNLDQFLDLDDKDRDDQIDELNEMVIQELFKIKGIGLSTTTKILHSLYPKIIPIIDSALQKKYRKAINKRWTKKQSDQIFIDFYKNLKEECNRKNLNHIFKEVSKNNLKKLTKIRIFDILWWSYLKAEALKSRENINWSTIKW
ncbi:MAG: hypothetical protein IBV53_00915 [Candidatus Atribacteria bacterium]